MMVNYKNSPKRRKRLYVYKNFVYDMFLLVTKNSLLVNFNYFHRDFFKQPKIKFKVP